MKKLFLLVAVVAMMLPSCKKINEALDSLDDRLNKLEQEAIPSIDEQISAINTTLGNLDAMDKELKGYIDGLTTTAKNLQDQIDNTNTKIDEVKSALQGEISTAKANVIAQLEAAKEELEEELKKINTTIGILQAKDTELEGKITELRTYVDTELGKTTDWVNATFATLEQYNALVSEVATIKEQIKAINQSIADLETRLTTKINEDIATAVSTLNADIQQKVKEITTAYTEAVKNAKEEITAAYTKAIQDAISGLELSLKSWVGQQLSNYYTIAEVEAKVLALQNAIAAGDSSLQEELNNLKSQLEASKKELTEAYKKAIEEAINTNNGVIDTKIANEVAIINKRISEEITAINQRITAIERRLADVEGRVNTIEQQISAINTTLDNLDAMDKELKGYIDGLTATANDLQEQINATNTKIGEVKAELQGEISAAKAEVLAELEALETELKNELAQINATIETLKAKDEELDKKIADLKTYIDTELGETTDWVNATFATLEQYNALVAEIATIKEQIKAINQSITDLETKLTTKINEDIANAVASLSADIQQKVKDITDAYTNAIKSAKEEITTAYTTAIQNAINALDASLKAWVGEQLANYYTIAEVEAKITALQTSITEGDKALQEELKSLKSQLETTAAEITAAYKKAIEEAINTNNGVIDTKIANEIASVNKRITDELATINAKIAEIESRLDNVEAKIAALLARIQSVSYIPTYDDGKATVKYSGGVSQVILDFKISPKECVAELEKVWKEVLKVEAVYTQTRAVSFVDMPIFMFDADNENGVISIIASGENLAEGFFAGAQGASASLVISDGNNSVTSDYIPMVAKAVASGEFIKSNQILYTSTDGKIVELSRTDAFDANIVSNTYANGQGVIVFDKDISMVGEQAFSESVSLASITIPESVTSIGPKAFYECNELKYVTLYGEIEYVGIDAFDNCNKLVKFYSKLASDDKRILIIGGELVAFAYSGLESYEIPNGVTKIGAYVFDWCRELNAITIPDSVTSIGQFAFCGCDGVKNFTIPNSVVEIGNDAFKRCGMTTVIIPDSVTLIGDGAFYECTAMTSVTIGNSVSSIGRHAFYGCILLKEVYCKPTVPPTVGYKIFDNVDADCKIYVPSASADLYRSADYWKNYRIYAYF